VKQLYPKVLLFGNEPFNYTQGYGITVSNLFRNWPTQNLMCLYIKNIVPDYKVCNKQIRITDSMQNKDILSKQRSKCNEESTYHNQTDNQLFMNLKKITKRFLNREKLGIGNVARYPMSKTLIEEVSTYNPDIIFSSITSLKEINFLKDIIKLIKVPVVLYIVDDWISNLSIGNNIFQNYWIRKTKSELTKVIEEATLCFGIGPDMCVEYNNRYGVEFFPVQNCPESSIWIENGRSDWSCSIPFRFIFTGGIYNSCNAESILEFARAISSLNGSSIPKFIFEIHTQQQHVDKWSNLLEGFNGCLVFEAKANQSYMAKLYGSADALLLPFDFDDKAKKASKFSMPTKLPVYLLSGAPVFGYGPQSTASLKYIKDRNCGYCIKERQSEEKLAEHIELFYNNITLREEIASKAQKVGKMLSAEV